MNAKKLLASIGIGVGAIVLILALVFGSFYLFSNVLWPKAPQGLAPQGGQAAQTDTGWWCPRYGWQHYEKQGAPQPNQRESLGLPSQRRWRHYEWCPYHDELNEER